MSIKFSTLKKEYSISCKDYVYLGFLNGSMIVVCQDVILGEFDGLSDESVKSANDCFYYYVNKI